MSNKGKSKHFDEVALAVQPDDTIGGTTSDKGKTLFTPAKDPPKPEVTPDQIEDFSVDGKKVYSRNTVTGEYTWYDGEGKVVDSYALENLNRAYAPYPDKDDQGTEKDGPLQRRIVDENNNSPGHPDYDEKKVWAISERQNYKSGQAITRTIPLKFAGIIKTLRGEKSG
jgi:hypothetical protein